MTWLLINPISGRGRGAALAERLRGDPGLEIRVTRSAGDLADLAREAARRKMDRLLVAGGDGTVHLAIPGLAGSDCALGVVPTGSGNDLARSLGVSRDPVEAIRSALRAPPRRIDLGSVDGRLYAGVAGVGFDGEVARFANERVQALRGRWIYPYAVMRTLMTFRPPAVRIDHDGGSFEGRVMLAVLANAPFFGGGMRIAPQASMDDGRLDLVIVKKVSALRLLAALPRVYGGRHIAHPAVRCARVSRARITADRPLTVYGDGERLAECREEGTSVEVRPRSLWVVV